MEMAVAAGLEVSVEEAPTMERLSTWQDAAAIEMTSLAENDDPIRTMVCPYPAPVRRLPATVMASASAPLTRNVPAGRTPSLRPAPR